MNKHLKNLNRIEFVVTSACTGRCKHCSQGEHRNSTHLDKNISANALRKIAEKYSINSVMTFGGEPLLCPETVFEIHKTETELNIPERQLITNGYFSKEPEKIKLFAQNLAECGVNEILLSVDAFHQETIPLDCVIEFAKAVIETDVKIKVHPAWLISREADNPYNRKTKDILKNFNGMGIETNEGNIIFPSGNALKYLSEYFDLNGDIKNPYEEDRADIHAICFSSNGDILGSNIYKKNITDILSEYSPE